LQTWLLYPIAMFCIFGKNIIAVGL